jgi:type I restriction enzyme S subunit
MEARTDLPENWEWTQLSQLCSLLNGDRGKNYPSRDKQSTEGFPFVNAGHLENDRILMEGMNFIDHERFSLLRSGKFNVGDILFCIRGSLGKVALNTNIEHGAIASSLIIVRPHKEIDTKYVLYYLGSPLCTNMIRTFDNGTAQPNLSGKDLGRFEFPVPPYREQLRIVAKIEELLSELDKGVENLKTALAQLNVYRQASLIHAFGGMLTAQWRKENKDKCENGNRLLSRIKRDREVNHQARITEWYATNGENGGKPRPPKAFAPLDGQDMDELPTLPDSGIWEKLGWMTCGVEYGTATKSSESGSVPVLRMGNIQNAKLDWSDLVYTSDEEEIRKYSLREGDVLFNRTNSPELVGKTAIYRGERPAVFAGYLIRVNQIPSIVDSQYLNLFLSSHIARKQGNRVKTDGVNQSNINGGKLSNYPFPFCSLAEQREIVRLLDEKLSVVDQMEKDANIQIQKADSLRQSILRKAFVGKLVAQNATDEPASTLLERIRSAVAEKDNAKSKIRGKAAA